GLEEMPQVVGKVSRRGVPFRRSLGQHLEADPLELAGDRVIDLTERPLVALDDLFEDLGVRVTLERPATGQELVEYDAQAEDIRSAVDPVPLAPGLLGAHVRGGSAELALLAATVRPERQP